MSKKSLPRHDYNSFRAVDEDPTTGAAVVNSMNAAPWSSATGTQVSLQSRPPLPHGYAESTNKRSKLSHHGTYSASKGPAEISKTTSKRPSGRHDDPRRKLDRAVCGAASFDVAEFRAYAAEMTFVHLRQTRPSLKPWAWRNGIWSTNQPLANGTLTGGCTFSQTNPHQAFEQSTEALVASRRFNMVWFCKSCKVDHHMTVQRSTLTLLGAGLLSRVEWMSYMKGISSASISERSHC